MRFIKIVILFLLEVSVCFSANAQKPKDDNTVAYRIYDDLPIDKSAEELILHSKESIAEKISGTIFIKVLLSKKKCFLGEPVRVTFELYSALPNESTISQEPSFQGFTVQKMVTNNEEAKYKKIKDQNFRVFTVEQLILTPYETGVLKLEPLSIQNIFSYENDKGERKEYAREISSQKEEIAVLPLPDADKPTSFSGGIGKFALSLNPRKTTVNTGENNPLDLHISGTGNLSNFSFPELQLPDEFKIADKKEKIDANSPGGDFYTGKTLSIAVIANKEGEFTISPVKVTCFNPDNGKYEEIQSEPVQIRVHAGSPVAAVTKLTNTGVVNESNSLKKIVAGVFFVLLVFATIFFVHKNKKLITENKKKMLITVQQIESNPADYVAIMQEAGNLQIEKDFLLSFKNIVRQYLSEKMGSDLSYSEELLLEQFSGGEPEIANQLKALMDECNKLLYSPGNMNDIIKKGMINKFIAIVNKEQLGLPV